MLSKQQGWDSHGSLTHTYAIGDDFLKVYQEKNLEGWSICVAHLYRHVPCMRHQCVFSFILIPSYLRISERRNVLEDALVSKGGHSSARRKPEPATRRPSLMREQDKVETRGSARNLGKSTPDHNKMMIILARRYNCYLKGQVPEIQLATMYTV